MEVLLSYYQITVFSLACIWALLFILRPELRREMSILGVLALFLLPLSFTANVSNDESVQAGFQAITLLDLLFSFLLAGIAGSIFHAVFGKHYHKLPKSKALIRKDQAITQFWLMRLFLAFLSFSWGVILLAYFFNIAIASAVFIAAIVAATYMLSHRKDLLVDAILSAILTAFVVFISSWIASQFASVDLDIAPIVSDMFFLGVPVDLLLWSSALGLAIGPMYEFIRRFELE